MNITLWQYMNDVMQMSINKERYWLMLTLLHQEARSRSYDISMFGIEKCKQPETLVSSKATTLKMKYSNIYSKTCAKQPLSKRPQIGLQDRLSLYAGQKYCRMPQEEHSAFLLTFI